MSKYSQWVLVVLLLALTICSCSNEENIIDGDMDSDSEIETLPDGDIEEEATPGCEEKGCQDGLYCDLDDGVCKVCVENSDCGLPDVVTGVYPVCRNSKCADVVCPAVVDVPVPDDGFNLPLEPLQPVFVEKFMIVDNTKVFPIGFQGLHTDLYGEAKTAGANLLVSTRKCCKDALDLQYQIENVLYKAKHLNMFAAIFAIWPYADYEITQQTIDAMTDRGNLESTLFWIASDRAIANSMIDDVEPIATEILDYSSKKPIAIFEDTGYATGNYPDTIGIHIVDLDVASGEAGKEIERVQTNLQEKPVWARIKIADYSEAKLKAVAVHAIAYGAKGIIIEIADEDNNKPDGWEKAKTVSRYLRDRTNIWLESADDNLVQELNTDKSKSFTVNMDGKGAISYLVNPSDEKQTITLKFTSLQLPFCMGFEGENAYLQITSKDELEIKLNPNEIKALHTSEAAYTGD